MRHDSEVVLVGNGVATLVAAARLLAQGRQVLLLNPDRDFFAEDSELALDPVLPPRAGDDVSRGAARLRASLPENALPQLRPEFPGAIELWQPEEARRPTGRGFRDASAPHVRARSRLWMASSRGGDWARMEDFFLGALDSGLKPQFMTGLPALRRFPGSSVRGLTEEAEDARALLVPQVIDVDLARYRYGLLEFVRERLGPEQLICGASQIDLIPEGIRFHQGKVARTSRVREAMLVFWTPRLTPWVLSQGKRLEVEPVMPAGVRIWEEWVLRSREPLDPSAVGVFEDMTVWAEIEGDPTGRTTELLTVLRPGARVPADSWPTGGAGSLASGASLQALFRLCQEFLRWERFSIRNVRSRALFEWAEEIPPRWTLSETSPRVEVVGGCDGPLVDVVSRARAACEGVA
jgi:hypothetical protein